MSFHYLASPYTHKDPDVMNRRNLEAMECLHWLLEHRVWTYSPIVHCHPIALRWALPRSNDFWKEYNRNMLERARSMLILKVDGWESSEGIRDETDFARKRKIEVTFIAPIKDGYLLELGSRATADLQPVS
jgi:hypothetical protein